jgi:ribonuclease BN (tRNA processing enzyme)
MNNPLIARMRLIWTLAAVFVIDAVVPTGVAWAQISAPSHPLSWTTLGTQGGPHPNAERSQPANLLVVDGKPWLVDCGDGALERLAAAGYDPLQVNTAFISHLHMDHIGGLQGLIGLRWFETGKHSLLTIYGPPGTDLVVAGIMQSLKPSVEIGVGVAMAVRAPEELTKVVIIEDGSDLSVDGVRIRAARNSHFDDPPGYPADDGSQTLSYRFDYKDYGVGYTGDTGPSDAVAHLEKGVNLLVSEVIDLQAAIAMIHESEIPMQAKRAMIEHFSAQHITAQEVGRIAAEAGAQRLVFTHLSITGTTEANAPNLIREAHKSFKGEVLVAHDLDRF